MPFPDLPPERIPGSPGHLNDHQLIDQALDYIQQAGYRDDPNFPPLPDVPVLGQSGHVTAHDRILAVLEYVKANPPGMTWAQVSNTPTGTYKGSDGHTWAYYTFTTSGTLTVTTAGYARVLLVAGGGGARYLAGSLSVRGSGSVAEGTHYLTAMSHDVTVGAGGGDGQTGQPSRLGYLVVQGGPSTVYGVPVKSFTSSITGKLETYGRDRVTDGKPNSGDGTSTDGKSGWSGVVIVATQIN